MAEKDEVANDASEQNEDASQAEATPETSVESKVEENTEVESKDNPDVPETPVETIPEVPTKGFFQAQFEAFQAKGEPKPLVRKTRKERIGKVTSDKMNKTITVVVERKLKHPIYGKFVTKTKKFLVHDEKEDGHTGDTVRIMECRPLSKRKRWRLVEVLERAK